MTPRRGRRHLPALFVLGIVVLLLAVTDFHTPLRPVLTLVFFAVAPGAAIVALLRLQADFLLEASLAIGISVVVSMVLAQVLLWTGLLSPLAAVLVVLTLVAVAPAVPARTLEEASR